VQGADATPATDLARVWGLGVEINNDKYYCDEGRQTRERVDLSKA
jgi:hypothetical protein